MKFFLYPPNNLCPSVAKDFDENGNYKLHVEIPLIDPEDVQNEA